MRLTAKQARNLGVALAPRATGRPPRLSGRRSNAPSKAEGLLPVFAAAGLPVPEAEYLFAKEATGRRWRFDFAWVERKIALEIDGGAFIGGRHTSGSGFVKDMEKFREAAILGWRVVRVTPRESKNGTMLSLMRRVLDVPQS